jgi:hypothetical protein
MKSRIHSFPFFLAWLTSVVFCTVDSPVVAQTPPREKSQHSLVADNLRPNGHWFEIGPAIFDRCQRVDLLEYMGRRQWKVLSLTDADHNFRSVRSWISGNIGSKLNYSERTPVYDNVISQAYIVLYSDQKGGEWESKPHVSATMKDGNNILLVAPLDQNFMGPKFVERTNELKQLILSHH